MKQFYQLLASALIAVTTTNFVWFALVFWAYLTTQSVISTSLVTGGWLVGSVLTSMWFGSIVDHHKKKHAMLAASVATLVLYAVGFLYYSSNPASAFASVSSPSFWLFAVILLAGSICGSMYAIAIPTLVGIMVAEKDRAKANGRFGTMMGISFAITSVASGFVLAQGGMFWILALAIVGTLLAIIALLLTPVEEKEIVHVEGVEKGKMDIAGTIRVVGAIPGLFALIFFTTFNNFLGGVFMALMDAYGLNLVPVEVWGFMLAILSFGFILGGLYIAKKGLGTNPLRNLFLINIITWTTCIFFAIQPSVILLAIGMFIWMFFFPFIEATEQTIFQKVVPPERLGRVFGFAHSIEQAASPITAFFIGPIAQFVFIPFMTTGQGVELIGSWFGTGTGRGIALVFVIAGILGLIATLIAMRSKPYKRLMEYYAKPSGNVPAPSMPVEAPKTGVTEHEGALPSIPRAQGAKKEKTRKKKAAKKRKK